MSVSIPIRAAVIGCGHIGAEHARFLATSDRSVLKRVCDVSESAARNLASATDPSVLFDDHEVDAVWICTHHDSHRPLAVRGAGAGKHLFIEKPLLWAGRRLAPSRACCIFAIASALLRVTSATALSGKLKP